MGSGRFLNRSLFLCPRGGVGDLRKPSTTGFLSAIGGLGSVRRNDLTGNSQQFAVNSSAGTTARLRGA